MIHKVCSAKFVVATCVLAAMIAVPYAVAAQDTDTRSAVSVRVVIPDSMPAFDPDVARKHDGAVVPWALVFPEAIGEEGVALIVLNPRHARLPTYTSALALLKEALSEGRHEIIVVEAPIEDVNRDNVAPARAAELRDLTASERVPLARLRGSGRMIEVALTYASQGG